MSIRASRVGASPWRSPWPSDWRWLGPGQLARGRSSAPAAAIAGASRSWPAARSSVRYNEGTKVQVPQDALYYLDYKAGRLLATVPSFQPVGRGGQDDRHVRRARPGRRLQDRPGQRTPPPLPDDHRLARQLQRGWSPLFVFESTTNQVAVYKLIQQQSGDELAAEVRAGRDAPDRPAPPARPRGAEREPSRRADGPPAADHWGTTTPPPGPPGMMTAAARPVRRPLRSCRHARRPRPPSSLRIDSVP